MEKPNDAFQIPASYIETGSATPFRDNEQIDLHAGREDLLPYDAITREAVGFATEVPNPTEVNLFERVGATDPEEAALIGRKTVEFRKAEASGIEPESLAISALRRQEEFDRKQFGLAA